MSINTAMTAIADAIRNKTGGTEKLSLDDMATAVEEVYSAGEKSQYDEFWDSIQNNGTRRSYNYAFAWNGWNTKIFKPKYNIIIGGGYDDATWTFANMNNNSGYPPHRYGCFMRRTRYNNRHFTSHENAQYLPW